MPANEQLYLVTKQIDFCYGHRLLNYDGKCRYLHGHNGRAEIAIASTTLDERGMVIDFSDVKSLAKDWIDEHLDHRMILNRSDPVIDYLQETGEPLYLMDCNPTCEAIALAILEQCEKLGLPVFAVRLWETPSSTATVFSTARSNLGGNSPLAWPLST